jgi:hypothetical protein
MIYGEGGEEDEHMFIVHSRNRRTVSTFSSTNESDPDPAQP